MANVAIGLPTFDLDDDIDRFIGVFCGYLNGLGLNPLNVADGPPSSKDRCIGLFRSCMKGRAANWYDQHIGTKPHVKLRNVLFRAAHGNEANFKGLACNNAACAVADFLGQALATRNNVLAAGNIDPHIWPDYVLHVNDNTWKDVANIEFTDEAQNHGDAGGNAGAGAGNPYVIPAQLCHYFVKLRRDLPQQQKARREIKFANLSQGGLPIREFFEQVRQNAKLLGFGRELIAHQFYRGLNDENTLEASRVGVNKDLEQLVDDLERVEIIKAEMGVTPKVLTAHYLNPPKATPNPQEPVILKPESQHGITREQLDQMLKTQAENLTKAFQAQLRQTRARPVQRPPVLHTRPKPAPKIRGGWAPYDGYNENYEVYEEMPDDLGEDPRDDPQRDPYDDIEIILGSQPKVKQIARRIVKKIAEAEDRRLDRDLARAMQGLSLDDDREGEPMDISNALRGNLDLVPNEDGSFSIQVTRKKN